MGKLVHEQGKLEEDFSDNRCVFFFTSDDTEPFQMVMLVPYVITLNFGDTSI